MHKHPRIHLSVRTAVVIAGLSNGGKGTLAKTLAPLHPESHIVEMGHEFRRLMNGDQSFSHEAHRFVRERMPLGDIAPLKVYRPIFEAAWARHTPKVRAAKLLIADSIVRRPEQLPIVRRAIDSLWAGEPYRVEFIWLERPDEVCLANWRKRLEEGSDRADDHGGEKTQLRRLRLAREGWAPIEKYLTSGRSSSGYRRLDLGADKIEHRLEEILVALGLQTVQPVASGDFFRQPTGEPVAAVA